VKARFTSSAGGASCHGRIEEHDERKSAPASILALNFDFDTIRALPARCGAPALAGQLLDLALDRLKPVLHSRKDHEC
jgi:hypothetical protein